MTAKFLKFSTLAAALMLVAQPACAAPLWGYSGLGLVPTGEVLPVGNFSVSGHLAFSDGAILYPLALSAGLLKGLEATVVYPGVWGLGPAVTGSVIYQLLGATRANPTRVAIGLTNIGLGAVPLPGGADSFVSPNNLFMVVTRDFNWPVDGQWRTLLSGHLGFTGATFGVPVGMADSKLMLGIEVPLTDAFDVYGEYLGPSARSGQAFDVGVRARIVSGLSIDAASLGQPGQVPLDRAYVVGMSYQANLPRAFKTAALSSLPAEPGKPEPPLAASDSDDVPILPDVAPPPAPVATLFGHILQRDGSPAPQAEVALLELGHWSHTTELGSYFLDGVPRGTYTLGIRNESGSLIATKSVAVPGDGPLEEDVRLAGPIEHSPPSPEERLPGAHRESSAAEP
ncbi:MAG: hypothetical protein KGR26_05455 [Cyanobacteria bacterium REEB65]|nr:hypothetical protein [Cyanobacteria bacterium REEB65]